MLERTIYGKKYHTVYCKKCGSVYEQEVSQKDTTCVRCGAKNTVKLLRPLKDFTFSSCGESFTATVVENEKLKYGDTKSICKYMIRNIDKTVYGYIVVWDKDDFTIRFRSGEITNHEFEVMASAKHLIQEMWERKVN